MKYLAFYTLYLALIISGLYVHYYLPGALILVAYGFSVGLFMSSLKRTLQIQ